MTLSEKSRPARRVSEAPEGAGSAPAYLLASIADALKLPVSFFDAADGVSDYGTGPDDGQTALRGMIDELEGAGDLADFIALARAFVELSRRRRTLDLP